jgi:hypothetical protein
MENNQTERIPDGGKMMSSIEWLIEKFEKYDVMKLMLKLHKTEIQQAKEMRMQELKHAYEAEQNNCRGIFKYESFEHYYKENYGK